MKKSVQIPRYVLDGINHSNKGLGLKVKIFGCDTETVNGVVHTLQMKDEYGEAYLYYVTPKTVLKVFFEFIDARLKRGEMGVAYFHNLNFDLPVMFSAEPIDVWNQSEFEVDKHGWVCKVNCEKRYFAKCSKDGKKLLQIVDSFSYLPTSLEKVAGVLRIPFKKLEKPAKLGQVAYTDKAFEEYAKADVDIELEFGKWIVDLHEKYDVPISVSFPQMCANIFKRQFLRQGDVLAFPPMDVVKPALLSYHGGKNGMWAEAGEYDDCSEIDLNSAYAWAMSVLPSFLKGEYCTVTKFMPQYSGVYRISGRIDCKYGLFSDHNFKPVDGEFKHLWVTGHEIEAGLAYGELRIDEIMGHVWIPDPKEKRNPFGDYVDYFYKLRLATPKTDPMYTFYKYAMNQLYGKTVQCIEVRKDGEQIKADAKVTFDKQGKMVVEERVKTFTAGGMFNPFIATQITALCRVRLHMLCHKFKALHAATDSIKTLEPITGESNELGGYKLEVKGKCLLFRNKLYVHYDGNTTEFAKIKKFALHGFTGRLSDLLELYESRKNEYTVKHMYKMREAIRQRKTPLTMVDVTRNFGLDWKSFKQAPRVF